MAILPPRQSKTTVDLIYLAYEDEQQEERTYLGCSTFGTECERAHWYQFRWVNPPEQFSGRKLRLFKTGHREEARMIADLRRADVEVIDINPDTNEQWGVSALGGHLRGHLDGLVLNIPEAPRTTHVLEVKTHNDKSYRDLLVNRVKKSKPGHYRQMHLYMGLTKIDRALYIAHNKNDDSLYVERVKFDRAEFDRLIARAERTISASRAPPKLFEDPSSRAAYVCQWCPSKGVCHEGDFARRNCRTCVDATPIIDDTDKAGRWTCDYWKKDLTREEQQRGCPHHVYLPSLVPGKQIDSDAEQRTVTYQMKNGSIWIDGGKHGL